MNAIAYDRRVEESARAVANHPLLAQVGNTPLLPLTTLSAGLPASVRLLGKAEWLNPTGSVKDRPAAAILQAALESGELSQERPLLDSTSGNMGIAYATFGAALGLEVHLAVPENASQARVELLRALGAHLILTDPLEGSDGARIVAAEIARREPDRYYYADQYANPANWQAHYQSTGPELLADTEGELTHIVAGLGTSGTLVGTGRFLQERTPGVEVVAVQPDGPIHGMEGLKHYASSPTPEIYRPEIVDRTVFVSTERAYELTRQLAREEGMLVGVSAGAAVAAALHVAEGLSEGTIAVILPDTGNRYLGEPFWREDGR